MPATTRRRVLALRQTKAEAEASARAWKLTGATDVQVEVGTRGTSDTSDTRPYAITADPKEAGR